MESFVNCRKGILFKFEQITLIHKENEFFSNGSVVLSIAY